MAKFHHRPLLPGGASGRRALDELLRDQGNVIVTRGSSTCADALTDARAHGDFDDDKPTMTSVLLRVLNRKAVDGHEYAPNSPLRARGISSRETERGGIAGTAEPARSQPLAGEASATALTADTAARGAIRVRKAQRPASAPPSPVPTAPAVDEAAAPDSGRVIIDRMTRNGWRVVPPAPARGGAGRGKR
ncbi:hypothetical protein CVO96_09425 [Deinococcus koreensis]|uniref:Uncharacterized protein n=2 Tax=Deinococcus koreensis TaxID=2054903 RepID=A0A2K3UYE5_9DEIO|nr:hypothetical protein CVO96_09425 [Deinococcus koreensis]